MPDRTDPWRRDPSRDEGGFAMIASMIVATVGVVLVTAILAQGVHLLDATSYDRRWNNALQSAEAGVEHTVIELTKDVNAVGFASPVTVPFGQFETAVSAAGGYREITSTGYAPRKGAANAVKRRVVVSYGPVPTFKYALFSDSTLDIKNDNANCTRGDVFANEAVTVKQNACVEGSVTSATGPVTFEANGDIKKRADGTGGSVYSGGLGPSGATWGIKLAGGVRIYGSAHAQREFCPPSPDGNYGIDRSPGGTTSVDGDAVAHSTIHAGITVGGVRDEDECETNQPKDVLPDFFGGKAVTLAGLSSLYATTVTEYTSVSAFNTYVAANKASLKGFFWVHDPDKTKKIDLGNVTVTDTFVLVTDNLITTGNSFEISVTDAANDFVNIISLNTSEDPAAPAIDINNTFVVNDPKPPVLVYSKGLIDVKNSSLSNGAFYAKRLNVKNNLSITYDPRVERTLGFGPARFARVSWREVAAS